MKQIHPSESRVRVLADAIRQLIIGRHNGGGTVTLTANAASTVITRDTISSDASFLAFPKTANAAAEMAAGTMHAVVAAGSITITHANNAQTDREFYYVASGG